MPGKNIPTFATDNIARKGFFFAGGKYWGEAGREVMRGAMYTEVWVPRQVRSPYPVVLFHGNGQTGVDWQQTADNRAGWAYRLIESGYAVYMVDYPARGRSAYVPLPGPDGKQPIDGNLGIRSALELERIFTNARERGDFPLKANHTQWPGTGKIGDPIFDHFIKTQVQFAGGTGALMRDASIALLDTIGSPVILFTHSQGGGFGFDLHRGAAQPGADHGDRGAGRSAVRQRRHRQGHLRPAQSELLGPDQQPLRIHAAGEFAGRPERRARGEVRAARRSALLDAGGAGAQADALAGQARARHLGKRHLPPRLRPVHPAGSSTRRA